MSRKEVVRPGLLRALVAGQLTNRQVARALRLSVRQVQRLKTRFRAGGAMGLMHRTRGQPSGRRLAPAVRHPVADRLGPSTRASTIATRPRSSRHSRASRQPRVGPPDPGRARPPRDAPPAAAPPVAPGSPRP